MKGKTLGDIVDEALDEYSPPKGKWGRFKGSAEDMMLKHYSKIILGTTLAFGAIGYYFGPNIVGIKDLVKDLMSDKNVAPAIAYAAESAVQKSHIFGAAIGACIGYTSSTFSIAYAKGKDLWSKVKTNERKKENRGKLFKYPKTLAALTTLGYNWGTIKGIPEQINTLIQATKILGPDIHSTLQYSALLKNTIFNIALIPFQFGVATLLFYFLRDVETSHKNGIKEHTQLFKALPAKMVGLFSKDKKIRMLKKAAEKEESVYIKDALRETILKKDINEGLIYCKDWMEEIASGKKGIEYEMLKKLQLGIEHKALMKEKENWLVFLQLTMNLYKENPEAAKKIIEHARKAMPEDRIDVDYLLNYFSEEIIKNPQEENWQKLAKKLQNLSKDSKLIQEFQSSEGRTWVYTGSKIINASLVSKQRELDYLERLVRQRFEYESLAKSGIKTEKPLGFFEESQKLYALTTRVGKTTLREALKGKNKDDKRRAFEKVIEDAIKSQKILFERLRKENGNFFMDAELGNKKYSVKLEVVNLEQQLLRRAFIGDDKRKNRFGANEHLEPLLKKIVEYARENYSPLILTVNHGDLFSSNITDQYARIDARHLIADTLYDTTHLALDPIFYELGRDERTEINFRKLIKEYDLNPLTLEPKFSNAYEISYLGNSLCLSASMNAQGNSEEAAQILKESLILSKGKPFQRELEKYLINSNAGNLMKII